MKRNRKRGRGSSWTVAPAEVRMLFNFEWARGWLCAENRILKRVVVILSVVRAGFRTGSMSDISVLWWAKLVPRPFSTWRRSQKLLPKHRVLSDYWTVDKAQKLGHKNILHSGGFSRNFAGNIQLIPGGYLLGLLFGPEDFRHIFPPKRGWATRLHDVTSYTYTHKRSNESRL
jgi:hypothetical protein